MSAILQTIIHTPVWVWALLALILWLGWSGLRTRTVVPGRLAILPVVATSISLFNALTSAQPLLAMPVWLVGLSVGAPLGVLIARQRGLEVEPNGLRVRLAGSWFPMVLGLSIFTIRYGMGVTAAFHPAWVRDPAWVITASAVSGVVAGIALGWLACLLLRHRRALRPVGGNANRAITAT
ncbi:DUF6622 family protein [Reyranella sp. CPCC 100927]|uniref:DUF6622 family protein n=1 Tax=Reyranella sp. CPCC 100927 TaxID=2599616 RepID=UPI0011B66942|nr:DUF6622 family protein [Reyranella sp. CPCC 100927]TWT03054.1 hypothetical protein FQU96_28350 [Reyranella sp. CPCC 100927]